MRVVVTQLGFTPSTRLLAVTSGGTGDRHASILPRTWLLKRRHGGSPSPRTPQLRGRPPACSPRCTLHSIYFGPRDYSCFLMLTSTYLILPPLRFLFSVLIVHFSNQEDLEQLPSGLIWFAGIFHFIRFVYETISILNQCLKIR